MTGWEILKWGAIATGGAVGLSIAGRAIYQDTQAVYDDATYTWQLEGGQDHV